MSSPTTQPAVGECPVAVLYADGDLNMRELVRDTLEDLGLRVALAAEPSQALTLAVTAAPAVILTDVCFPDGGVAYLVRLRAVAPHVPIVLVSSYSDTAAVLLGARSLGVVATLTKPVHMRDLLAAIGRHVSTAG